MSLDQKTETRLQAKISIGELELRRLQDCLGKIVADFTDTWNKYGSELAGNDGGDVIREKIRIAKARLEPLKKALSGELDLSKEASIARTGRMCELDRAIGLLSKEREKLNDECHEANIARSILGERLDFVDRPI